MYRLDLTLPACRRLLFPLLFPRATKEIGDVCTQARSYPVRLFFGFLTFLFFALSAQILLQPQETISECWSLLRAGRARGVGSVSSRPWTGLDAPTDIYGWRLTNYGSSLSRNDGKMARFAVCAASSLILGVWGFAVPLYFVH